MNLRISSFLLSGTLALGLTLTTAMALNSHYTPGDLVLYFQQEGGTNTIYIDLGNAATQFRGAATGPDVANKINFLNINAALTSAFGTGWASDPTVYAGLAGVWGISSTLTNNTLQDGDPNRTIYLSGPRSSPGTAGQANSAGYTVGGNTAMSTASSQIAQQNSVFADANGTNGYDAQAIVSPTSISLIDENNPFMSPGVLGNAFNNTFGGGVMQSGDPAFGTVGAAGNVEFALDLYRIQAKNNAPGQVGYGETARLGTFEGTVTVNSSGMVSFVAQGSATSAYTNWLKDYPSITADADKLPTADPDHDGATNLEEFAFGGSPTSGSDNGIRLTQTVDANNDSQRDLTLTLEVRSGAVFTLSNNAQVSAPIDQLTYYIEGSTNLINWDSPVSEVTPALTTATAKTGYVFKTFRLNVGNGLGGKGFIRAVVTQ